MEWYSGRYDKVLLGIVPVGNLVEWVNRIHKDVAILEEPEHLNWYHSGMQWTEGFSHVVSSRVTKYLLDNCCSCEDKP